MIILDFLKDKLCLADIVRLQDDNPFSLKNIAGMQIVDSSQNVSLKLSDRMVDATSIGGLDLNDEDVITVDVEVKNLDLNQTEIVSVYVNQEDTNYVKNPPEFQVAYRLGILAENSSWDILQKGRLIAYECKYCPFDIKSHYPIFRMVTDGMNFSKPIYSKQVIDEKVYKLHILAKQVLLIQENPWLYEDEKCLSQIAQLVVEG